MKRILVPTDFSALSKASFEFAVDMASRAHADVFTVHMIELPLLPETTFGIQPYPLDPEALRKAIATSNKQFEEIRKQFPTDVKVYFNNVNDHVVPGIMKHVEENEIDIIVIGTHSASDFQDFFIGSTAEKIGRLSPVPVIFLPRATKPDAIKNIVFPSTLELDQDDLMKHLRELQQLLTAKLHVLLINTPVNFYNDQQAMKKLERFARHYELHDFTLNVRSHQDERNGILEFMDEIKGDMIAMATHGRTGFAHFFKGSITESVLIRSNYPIWTWKIKTTAPYAQ